MSRRAPLFGPAVVAVEHAGVVEYHAPPVGPGAHDTLCGLHANDPHPAVRAAPACTLAPAGQRITCPQCWQVWRDVQDLRLTLTDFSLTCRGAAPPPRWRP